MQNKINPEDLEVIKKAKEQQSKMASAGVVEKNDIVEEKKTYETFIEIDNIPSRNFAYSNPITGQPLKVDDLLLIQGIDDNNINKRMSQIFDRRIRGCSPGDILIEDELYIALWLRATTFPFPDFPFPYSGYTCKKCGLEVDETTSEFGFHQISHNSNIEDIIKLYDGKQFVEFTIPNGMQFKIQLKRRKHVARVENILHRDFYQYKKKPPTETENLLHAISILDFDVPDLMDGVETVKKLDPIDFVSLLKNINKYSLHTDIIVNQTCPDEECKEVTPLVGYPFYPELYLPINI